jgi:hypothetical protein
MTASASTIQNKGHAKDVRRAQRRLAPGMPPSRPGLLSTLTTPAQGAAMLREINPEYSDRKID